jgi:hypothetical protein
VNGSSIATTDETTVRRIVIPMPVEPILVVDISFSLSRAVFKRHLVFQDHPAGAILQWRKGHAMLWMVGW